MIYSLRQGTHYGWPEQIVARVKYIVVALGAILLVVWLGELFFSGSQRVRNPTGTPQGQKGLNVSNQSGQTATNQSNQATSPSSSNAAASSTTANPGVGSFFGSSSGASNSAGVTAGSAPSGSAVTGGRGGGSTGGGTSGSSSGGSGAGDSGSVILTVPGTCVDALGKPIVCTGATTIDPAIP